MWEWGIAAAAAAWALYGSVYSFAAEAGQVRLGRWIKAGKRRLHVIARGEQGPAVVCLHGASANAREWLPLMALLQSDCRVFAIDRPGHGFSPADPRGARLDVQAGAIADAIEALGAAPAVIVAHSLGCASALRVALDRPELVAGLVLASPATHPYPGGNAWHVRLAATPFWGALFCRLIVPLFGPLQLRKAVAKTFAPASPPNDYLREAGTALVFRPKDFRNNSREVAATSEEFAAQYWRYDEIAAPAAIISTDRDAVVSPRIHARALARTLPKAELIVAPGAGHMPHRLRPEALAAAARRLAALAEAEAGG